MKHLSHLSYIDMVYFTNFVSYHAVGRLSFWGVFVQ